MVDANRLSQVLAGSRADRLKRPIDAAGVWLRISRSNGIPEFPVRRDELTEDLEPINALATNALETAQSKVDAGQVLALLNSAFADLFQEYVLNNGIDDRQIDPIDNREYIYTIFQIDTRYPGTFEELALVSNDANETLLDVEYGVYKEYPGRIVLVFRDMSEGFPNDIAKIKLVGIPSINAIAPTTTETGIRLAPEVASVGANTEITLTFTGFDVNDPYQTDAYLGNSDAPPVTALLPAAPGANTVVRFNASILAGLPLPGQLVIVGRDKASNPITINP